MGLGPLCPLFLPLNVAIPDMSEGIYQGFVFTEQLALESSILTSHREMEELYHSHQELSSMFLHLRQQFDAYCRT